MDTSQIYLNTEIMTDEILKALKKYTSKTLDPNNIPFIFIHNFSPTSPYSLLQMYNWIWNNKNIPKSVEKQHSYSNQYTSRK